MTTTSSPATLSPILSQVIRARRTAKVLADPTDPLPLTELDRATIDQWVADAGWAPFHYPCAPVHRRGAEGNGAGAISPALTSPAPWRMYQLDGRGCRSLLAALVDRADAGKIRDMLAAAAAMIVVTWLPDPPADQAATSSDGSDARFAATDQNAEHIAAAGAAVQNLLLRATSDGWQTYWSSGGILRGAEMFQALGINPSERALGAIFIFPPDTGPAEVRPGKLREARGKLRDWSRWVEL
ncbi:MAG: nitroreductase family protein [Pseudomonadota bacterium]